MKDISDAYRLLGLSVGDNLTKVKKKYHELVKVYHPDIGTKKDTDMMVKITEAYNQIAEHIKSAKIAPPITTAPPKPRANIQIAMQSLKRGIEYLEKGDINNAISIFETIQRQFPKEEKFKFYLVKALMQKQRRIYDAKSICYELIQENPFEPKYHKLMGDIYLKAGLAETANKYYEKAASFGMEDYSLQDFYNKKPEKEKEPEKGLLKGIFKGFKKK